MSPDLVALLIWEGALLGVVLVGALIQWVKARRGTLPAPAPVECHEPRPGRIVSPDSAESDVSGGGVVRARRSREKDMKCSGSWRSWTKLLGKAAEYAGRSSDAACPTTATRTLVIALCLVGLACAKPNYQPPAPSPLELRVRELNEKVIRYRDLAENAPTAEERATNAALYQGAVQELDIVVRVIQGGQAPASQPARCVTVPIGGMVYTRCD